MSKFVECKDCEQEFNPSLPQHKNGFYNQCGDCAKEGETVKAKAIINYSGEGDFMGISVVSNSVFEKYKQTEKDIKEILND